MKLSVALRLGRVSNQPTVWTNVLAGIVLAGGGRPVTIVGLIAGVAVMYTAGMFLNDAFDADFDRAHRPERPIPLGQVTLTGVFGAGFAMLALGLVLIVAAALQAGGAVQRSPPVPRWPASLCSTTGGTRTMRLARH